MHSVVRQCQLSDTKGVQYVKILASAIHKGSPKGIFMVYLFTQNLTYSEYIT